MMIKWLRYGTGLASEAVRYVLADHDHKGTRRPRVEILRGDPQFFADMADSLDFKHRYQSGVVSWAEEDAPTDEQINAVLEDIEAGMLAGFGPDADPSRLAWIVVLHKTDLHILVARVDLATGKSYAVAPPGWQKLYDPIRDMHNYRHGWSRPDDPLRARPVQPGHEAFVDAAALRTAIQEGKDDPLRARPVQPGHEALVDAAALLTAIREEKEQEGKSSAKMRITDWVLQRIEARKVVDREGVRKCLAELGEITREHADYISVKLASEPRAIRLRGGIYAADFDGPAWLSRPPPSREPDPEAEEAARKDFEKALKWRADRDAGRYRVPEPKPVPAPAARSRRDAEPERKRDSRPPMNELAAAAAAGPGEPALWDDLEWLNALEVPEEAPEIEDPESGWQRLNEWIRSAYERIGEDLARRFRAAVEAARGGYEAARRSGLALAAAGAGVQRAAVGSAFKRFDVALGDHDRGLRELDRELQRLAAADARFVEALRGAEQREVDLDAEMRKARPRSGPESSSGPGM